MSLTITRDAYFALVGKEIGISAWHTVDQSRIDAFADVTEDHQFIHIDPERAAREIACPCGGSAREVYLARIPPFWRVAATNVAATSQNRGSPRGYPGAGAPPRAPPRKVSE